MNDRIIARSLLEGTKKYDYCPYCVKELTAQGQDYQSTLKPLFRLVKATYDQKRQKEIRYETYECPKCKRADITVETFLDFYCE
jgi:hypothetical protein